MEIISKKIRTSAIALVSIVSFAATVSAGTIEWTNTTDSTWNDSNNWNPNTVPNSDADSVLFGAGGFGVTPRTVTLDVDATVAGITINPGSISTYFIVGDNTLTLDSSTGSIAISCAAAGNPPTHQIRPDLKIADPVLATGRLTALMGDISGTAGNPDVDFTVDYAVNQRFIMTGNNNFGSGTLHVQGAGTTIVLGDNSTGGSNTTVRFDEPDTGVISHLQLQPLAVGGVAQPNGTSYDLLSDFVVEASEAMIQTSTQGYSDADLSILGYTYYAVYNIGSLTVKAGNTLTFRDVNAGVKLSISSGEVAEIQSGATLLMTDVNNTRSSDLLIADGAMLRGEGTVLMRLYDPGRSINDPEVIVQSGGTLAAGSTSGTGILTLGAGTDTNSLVTLQSGAELRVRVGGTTAGSLYDQVSLAGQLNLTDAILTVVATSTMQGGQATIVNSIGPETIGGTFSGLAEGATVTFDASGRIGTAKITYVGGNGNDVVLYDLDVPAPGTVISVR